LVIVVVIVIVVIIIIVVIVIVIVVVAIATIAIIIVTVFIVAVNVDQDIWYYLVPASLTPPQPTAGQDHPPQVEKKGGQFIGRSTTLLVLSATVGQIKGSCWHPQTAHHLDLCWVLPFASRLRG
jgi:hypothetical protein